MLGKCFGEFMGTLILVLLGDGVVANVLLKRSKAEGAGWMVIASGWAFAVMAGVFTAIACGSGDAHLNPAVTMGFAVSSGHFDKFAPYLPRNAGLGFGGRCDFLESGRRFGTGFGFGAIPCRSTRLGYRTIAWGHHRLCDQSRSGLRTSTGARCVARGGQGAFRLGLRHCADPGPAHRRRTGWAPSTSRRQIAGSIQEGVCARSTELSTMPEEVSLGIQL